MPLHSLVRTTEGGRPDYSVVGDFNKMMYFCPDIRFNYKDKTIKDKYVEKTQEELSQELRLHLKGLSDLAFTWLDKKIISDYWLVITPEACDYIQQHFPEFNQPQKNNNYIVTPFYTDDIDLVDSLFKKIPGVFGSVELHSDPRRRRGTEACISVYMACEINEDSEYFEDLNIYEKGSEEYNRNFAPALLSTQLDLGGTASEYIKQQVRTFLQYGTDRFGTRFVEQYFNHKATKKTNGFLLGEGYVRNRMAKVNLDKNEKYAAFHDLFASAGYQFADYALSKEDLREKLTAFEANSWVKFEDA
jgi:hypothetical protein